MKSAKNKQNLFFLSDYFITHPIHKERKLSRKNGGGFHKNSHLAHTLVDNFLFCFIMKRQYFLCQNTQLIYLAFVYISGVHSLFGNNNQTPHKIINLIDQIFFKNISP